MATTHRLTGQLMRQHQAQQAASRPDLQECERPRRRRLGSVVPGEERRKHVGLRPCVRPADPQTETHRSGSRRSEVSPISDTNGHVSLTCGFVCVPCLAVDEHLRAIALFARGSASRPVPSIPRLLLDVASG